MQIHLRNRLPVKPSYIYIYIVNCGNRRCAHRPANGILNQMRNESKEQLKHLEHQTHLPLPPSPVSLRYIHCAKSNWFEVRFANKYSTGLDCPAIGSAVHPTASCHRPELYIASQRRRWIREMKCARSFSARKVPRGSQENLTEGTWQSRWNACFLSCVLSNQPKLMLRMR